MTSTEERVEELKGRISEVLKSVEKALITADLNLQQVCALQREVKRLETSGRIDVLEGFDRVRDDMNLVLWRLRGAAERLRIEWTFEELFKERSGLREVAE